MPTPIELQFDNVGNKAVRIKASAGTIYSYSVVNNNAVPIYVKFYDKAAADVNPASDVPAQTITVPAADVNGAGIANDPNVAYVFATAIAARVVVGALDNDTTAPAICPTIEVELATTVASLPNPSSTTLGGIQSAATQAHKWINGISTSGVPSLTQPASADLSDASNVQLKDGTLGLAGFGSITGAVDGSNVSGGTLGATAGTNLTGTAAGLTAGHVTTNANLTGDVTSSGNASTLANIPAISGANLTTLNATNLSSGTVAAARLPGWTIKTANYTAVAGDKVLADTSGGAFTVTLPASPSNGDEVRVTDAQGSFATHTLTVGRNSQSIAGAAADLTSSTNNAAFSLVFAGGTIGWQVVRFQ